MNTFLFLFILTLCFSAFFWWAFRVLPGEKWQILASIPLFKKSHDQWEGLNLTYYGFLLASAGTLAGCAFIFLMKSLGIATPVLASLFLTLFFLCGIAARAVAYLVENKKNTFTVGGAAFTGILIMPILVVGINFYSSYAIPLIPVLAALTISYAFGEGIGRIACISFGCCYGKPLSEMKPMTRRFFRKVAFVFEGKTKKIAYASGLDGQHMFPIQGLTALVYVVTGLVGLYLFLESYFTGSLLVTALMTQGWRAYSEVLRSDYRGDQKISVYQIMALVGMVYVVGLSVWYRVPAPVSLDLGAGLQAIWNPATILGLQAIWLLLFLYTGTSKVTGSHLQFHVKKEHI